MQLIDLFDITCGSSIRLCCCANDCVVALSGMTFQREKSHKKDCLNNKMSHVLSIPVFVYSVHKETQYIDFRL